MADVLIVDDNLDACRPLARLLGHFGTRAVCVDGGEKALEQLRHAVPRLILLDVMMPEMDGLEVLRRVREDPRTARIPVVMFSASSDPAHQDRAAALGANEYWLKGSLDFDALRDGVSRYVGTAA